MGIRLVKYGVNSDAGTYKHDELQNRDLADQHPIEAITGLNDTIDTINNTITETANTINNTILKEIQELQKLIDDSSGIDAVEETPSLALTYDATTKTLSGNVKIFNSKDNALIQKSTGLYVDKYSSNISVEDTSSIHLSLGEISLQAMYDTRVKFSHYYTWSNIYNASEANTWYYDASLKSFVQPSNSDTFNGFVSSIKYRNYVHRVTIKANDTDNDCNGIIVAYAIDSNGHPNTLSLVLNMGGQAFIGPYFYALVYNKNLPGEQILFTQGNGPGGTVPGNNPVADWAGTPITLQAIKAGSIIKCAASNYYSNVINLATTIEIDLDKYAWGYLFRDEVQFGYCNQSQGASYFYDIYFSNNNGSLKATPILSKTTDNLLQVLSDGLYASKNDVAMKVSSQSDNALSLKSDGIYLSNENLTGQSSQIKITQTGHGFVVGNALYNTSSGYRKGIADNTPASEIVGIVSQVVDVNTFKLCTNGFLQTTIFDSSTNGAVLFLSDTTAGLLTSTEPPLVSKPIAVKVVGGIVINIQRGTLNNTDASNDIVLNNIDDKIGDFKYSYDTTQVRTDGYILFKDGIAYDKYKMQELIDKASSEFVTKYIIVNQDTISFQHTDEIINTINYQGSLPGANLYIKAYSNGAVEIHTHSNKSVLDGLADSNGALSYKGIPINPVSTFTETVLWSGQANSNITINNLSDYNILLIETRVVNNTTTRIITKQSLSFMGEYTYQNLYAFLGVTVDFAANLVKVTYLQTNETTWNSSCYITKVIGIKI